MKHIFSISKLFLYLLSDPFPSYQMISWAVDSSSGFKEGTVLFLFKQMNISICAINCQFNWFFIGIPKGIPELLFPLQN